MADRLHLSAKHRRMLDEWNQSRWGDLATLEYGKALRANDMRGGSVPVFGTNGQIGWHDEPLSSEPGVIVGRKGAYRGVHYSRNPFYVIDTAFYLKTKIGLDMRWAYYQLLTQDINSMDSGSAIPSTSREEFYELPVVVPPPNEQRAIADVLGTLDDKIELNHRMNETLEAMAHAIFKDWFVDFGPTRAKIAGREPYLPSGLWSLFPDRLVTSELGEIPERWAVRRLGEVVEVAGGTTPSTKVTEYWEGGSHCWATPKDIASLPSVVLLATKRKITDAGLSKIGSGLLPLGTVLLSSRAPIGYLAITEIPVAINQGFIGILPNKYVPNLFVRHWCELFHEQIVNNANGSTFLEISKGNFRLIPLVMPQETVMAAFDRVVRSLYERVVSNERESGALAVQRSTLLPQLISGKVRVF